VSRGWSPGLAAAARGYGVVVTGTDAPDVPDGADATDEAQSPVERLQEHLGEVSDRPDEMQQRLDDLGESIEATRRRAEEQDLLPDDAGPTAEPGEDSDLPAAPGPVDADDADDLGDPGEGHDAGPG
jgi:hypothetical protein